MARLKLTDECLGAAVAQAARLAIDGLMVFQAAPERPCSRLGVIEGPGHPGFEVEVVIRPYSFPEPTKLLGQRPKELA